VAYFLGEESDPTCGLRENVMADIAVVFHWSPLVMSKLTIEVDGLARTYTGQKLNGKLIEGWTTLREQRKCSPTNCSILM
jgi:hypothetical protein